MTQTPALPAATDPARDLVRALRKLTPTQRRVLKALPENGGQFWGTLRKLGHSQHTGHRWMRNEAFVRARELLEQRAAEEVGISVQRVLREQAAIAFSDPRDLYDAAGELLPVHQWPDAVAQAVSSIEVEELFEGTGKERRYIGTLRKVKRWDKPKALEQLSRYLGMLKDDDKPPDVGPGLTVIVQQGANTAAVHAGPGAQGRVVVDLQGPE